MANGKWRIVAVATTLAATGSLASAQSVELRYKWTKGDALDYRVTLHTTSDVSGVPGRDDTRTEQTITQRITLTVDGVAAGGTASVHETVTQIRSEVSTAMGKIVFDTAAPTEASKDPVAEALGKMFTAVVGQPINIVFGPDGTVRSVEGGSRLLERIVEAAGANREAGMASQALTSLYSDESLRTMLEQSFPRLPTQPVKPGDTWTGQLALGNQTIGRITAGVTFTLKNVEGAAGAERAAIAAAMTLKQEVKPPAAGATRVTLTLGDSRGQGDLAFDIARGRIVRSSMHTEMPSTVSMLGESGSPITFKNRVNTTSTMELVGK